MLVARRRNGDRVGESPTRHGPGRQLQNVGLVARTHRHDPPDTAAVDLHVVDGARRRASHDHAPRSVVIVTVDLEGGGRLRVQTDDLRVGRAADVHRSLMRDEVDGEDIRRSVGAGDGESSDVPVLEQRPAFGGGQISCA